MNIDTRPMTLDQHKVSLNSIACYDSMKRGLCIYYSTANPPYSFEYSLTTLNYLFHFEYTNRFLQYKCIIT
ncbi:MAG: hypothetical protein K0R46_145 [Herbinix sp.]|jgi:hypothetical protein|nr:hypothetical protein [Herbinix sp.]